VGLRVGQISQLTATPRDAAGNAVSGQTISWTTSDQTVATVDGSGAVSAASVGTATITAETGGYSGTATVAVSQPSVGYPNEPAGAVPVSAAVPFVHDQANLVSTYPETDAQPFSGVNGVGSVSFTVTDNTAPLNPTKVGAVLFRKDLVAPQGSPCENGGCTVGKMYSSSKLAPPKTGNVKEWYCSLYFKIQQTNLEPEIDIYGLKFINFWGGDDTMILQFYPSDVYNHPQGPWRMGLIHVGGSRGIDYSGATDASTLAGTYAGGNQHIFQKNTWYHVETIINYVTKRLQVFVDGNIYRDSYSNLGYISQPQAFEWSRVWGGGRLNYWNDPAFNEFMMYHDETYCSYTTTP